MKKLQEKLIDFRNKLYSLFPKRKDAIFELLDANSASDKSVNSVVQLSLSPFFTRQYPSITDAISDGLKDAPWDDIQTLLWQSTHATDNVDCHRFIIDSTPQDRLHAKTLSDRSIVHKANPAPGNKPICAGHEYSTVVYLPQGDSEERKRWVVPLSTQRVPSEEKGHDVGIHQLSTMLQKLGLEGSFTLSIADSAYTTETCRQQLSELNEHVHIARLRNNRKVFALLQNQLNKKGRKKIYGKKMMLNNPASFLPHDEDIIIPHTSKKGSKLSLVIKSWNTVVFRGSRHFKSHEHPFRIVQIIVLNEHQKPVFKKPLWLAIFGDKRLVLSAHECFTHYCDRYDIEHYFRFGKQRLRMDSFQTCDTEHEENWWKLCALSYNQLYLSKELCQATPESWERYLPEFKTQESLKTVSAPFTQRGFPMLLRTIGTPAKRPTQRGNPLGRKLGERPDKRVEKPVNFKQAVTNPAQQPFFSTLGKEATELKPKNKHDVIDALHVMLKEISMSMESFCQFAISTA